MIKGYILPHPPIAVSEVGRGEELQIKDTLDSFAKVAEDIAAYKPETIVVISPHSRMYRDAFYIAGGHGGEGNLSQFRAPSVSDYYEYDEELASEFVKLCEEHDIPTVYDTDNAADIDHGTVVPLYFVNKAYTDYKLLRIAPSLLDDEDLMETGKLIERAIAHVGRRAVIIASGDLSHKLREDGPYGYIDEGPVFDRAVTDIMKSGQPADFMSIDKKLADKAVQCGLPGFIMLAGALGDYEVTSHFLSYEGTFGVGYGICIYECSNWYTKLAKQSLETFINTGKRVSDTSVYPNCMRNERAGVFVCIKIKGRLRGCIGTIMPTCENVLEEVIELAISAGTHDYRFYPVDSSELPLLDYTVDVMGTPEEATYEMLDEKRYGVIVTCGERRGLLLPNLEGVDSVDEQIAISLEKGNIRPDEPYLIQRFTVERHS